MQFQFRKVSSEMLQNGALQFFNNAKNDGEPVGSGGYKIFTNIKSLPILRNLENQIYQKAFSN